MSLLKDIWRLVLPGPEPTLDLDFTAEALDPRITFTRASTKTYYDSAGFLRTAAVNAWPREYDPSTVTRYNLLPQSKTLTAAGLVVTNGAVTPIGTDGALVQSVAAPANSAFGITQNGIQFVAGQTYCLSVLLRAFGVPYMRLGVGNLSGVSFGGNVTFDLVAGTVVTSQSDASANAQVTHLGNGVYRLSRIFRPELADTNGAAIISFMPLSSFPLWAEGLDGSQQVEFYGWQVEPGTTPSDIIATGALAAGDGMCVGRSAWEQRSNLVLRSQEFDNATWSKSAASVVANAMTAPDGTVTAEKLVEDSTATADKRVHQNFSLPAAPTSYAFTVFAKAGERSQVRLGALVGGSNWLPNGTPAVVFDLNTGAVVSQVGNVSFAASKKLPNGWWRLEVRGATSGTSGVSQFIVGLANAGTTSYTGDGASGIYIWGAQLEIAQFAGPYIPTTSSAVTMSAEQVSISNLSSFSYSASAGSWATEFETVNVGAASTLVALSLGDGTSGGFLSLANNDRRGIISTFFANLPGSINSYSNRAIARVVLTMVQSGANISAKAWSNYPFGPVSTEVVGRQLSSYIYLGIGGRSRGGGSNDAFLGSYIRRVRYWPIALTDAEMAGQAG